jgi:hypothetical protein
MSSFLQKIDRVLRLDKRGRTRQRILRFAEKWLGYRHHRALVRQFGAHPEEVVFRITGGVGDHIVSARLIRDISIANGTIPFIISSIRGSICDWIFRSVPGYRGLTPTDIPPGVVKVHFRNWITYQNHFINLKNSNIDWKDLGSRFPGVVRGLRACESFNRPIQDYIDVHPERDNALVRHLTFSNLNRYNVINRIMGVPELGQQLSLSLSEAAIDRNGLRGRLFITVHNGFDPEFSKNFLQTATKVFHKFDSVIVELRRLVPDIVVVQIGVQTSSPIHGVDINLLHKTTMPEVGALLKHAALHIDSEGGLVHLAAAVGGRSAVFFGPTPADYFGYPDNLNFEPRKCGGCWWIKPDWMERCSRGFEVPICLESIPADEAAQQIADVILTKVPVR